MIDKTNKTTSKKKSKQNASLKKKKPKNCRPKQKQSRRYRLKYLNRQQKINQKMILKKKKK